MEICLIGSSGYIGSCLSRSLNKFALVKIGARQDRYDQEFIQRFRVIIYLGGKSTRGMTEEEIPLNVDEIVAIGRMMRPDQLLIYASTSAILEGHFDADESAEIKEELLDNYSRSMFEREKAIRALSVRSVGLRLGSVVGISPKQRSDRLHIQILKSALFTGRIHVRHPLSQRPILSMSDLTRSIDCLIKNEHLCQQGEIFNIASYNTTVQVVASNIALLTGAQVVYHDSANNKGFSIDSHRFERKFGFKFESTDESIMKELVERKRELLESWKNPVRETIPCLVCGQTRLLEMIDLGNQPLANQFTREKIACQEYPLAMYRCLNCQHNQLGYIAPPEALFTDYIYVTGTTKTIDQYCADFAERFSSETGRILDIACNDGTQLDKFKKRGWKTYGVDPAKNLEPISSAKGHKIVVGFWGQPETTRELCRSESTFDLIVAQNVFAHVPNPGSFLRACREVMSDQTRLYIQTSQAEIFQTGEFDTIYHEHLSFFTVKSMLALSQKSGLHLESVEKVPIHGISYLFMLKRSGSGISESVAKAIEEEATIYEETNPIFYRSHVLEKKNLVSTMLTQAQRDGFTLVGFGASAKGNTLLNFIRGEAPPLEYIIDENSRKQFYYTPGTQIEVLPYSRLVAETRPVAILILAWNFLEEIKQKVVQARGGQPTLLVVPFPNPSLLLLRDRVWLELSSFKLPVSLDRAKPKVEILLVTHFYNEELLLPYWIMHHASLFDHAVLIDYDSTDRSRKMIKKLAPPHWKVIRSRNREFDARAVDAEVRDAERSYPDHVWKIALTMTEFLICPNLRETLAQIDESISALAIANLCIVGNDSSPLKPGLPLVQQRAMYGAIDPPRFIHRFTNESGELYGIGRHEISLEAIHLPEAAIYKFFLSPWPEILPRKLQIAARQPQSDIEMGLGFHHQRKQEELEEIRAEMLKGASPDLFREGLKGDDYQLDRSGFLAAHLGLPWSSRV